MRKLSQLAFVVVLFGACTLADDEPLGGPSLVVQAGSVCSPVGVTSTCTTSAGAGTMTCGSDGKFGACTVAASPAPAGVCISGQSYTCTLGGVSGTTLCTNGAYGACVVQSPPTTVTSAGNWGSDWACKASGSKMLGNPTFTSGHPSARIRIYGGPLAGTGMDGVAGLPNLGDWTASASADGYAWDFIGKPVGEYRFSYGRTGANDWAEYGSFAPNFSGTYKQFIEKDLAQGSFGCRAYWDGANWTPRAGNY